VSFPRIPSLLIYRQLRTIDNSRRTGRNATIIRRNWQEEYLESNIPVPSRTIPHDYPYFLIRICKGAYTESFSISPELNKYTTLTTPPYLASQPEVHRIPYGRSNGDQLNYSLRCRLCRSIQTNIIKVHHTRTASHRIVLVAKTNSNSIDIGQVHALVCKCLQVNIPLGPLIYLCRI